MSASGLEGIDHSVQQTHIWINEVDEKLGWDNKPRAYRLLKAVLHAVRDHLQVNEAVDLGAQLPTFLRGVYYDQWRPAKTPVKDRHLDSFLAVIDNAFRPDPIDDTAEAAAVVFAVMSGKVTWGEIDEVRKSLPAAIRALWPVPSGGTKRRA
ncbi:MAG: DUF2267 domain-containing protein [Bauldia sp.]|nr:DUF2267 domain-containing protein [Bauldia sp.]